VTAIVIRMQPEPPEQWHTVETAIKTRAKTLRLCLILLVRSLPLILALAAAVFVALAGH
jgi:hypothetical protein